MSKVCLQQQISRLADVVEHSIRSLPPIDPLKDWFFVEIDALKTKDFSENASLEEENSRLRGLQQLQHLLLKHRNRLGIADDDAPTSSPLDSYLTAQARLPASVRASTRQMRFSIEPSLLHEAKRVNATFDPVSPTAKIVAYLRGLDKSLQFEGDEPLREEGATTLKQLGIYDSETHVAMAVLFQSRYHAINAAIGMTASSALQIIEFAAGVSPRGFQWSQMSPGTIYIESDLPQLMIRKAKLVRNALMQSATANRGVLHYCANDVLDLDSMLESLKSIDTDMPFTIVTEGLLLYFTNDELKRFLDNMRILLSQGRIATWITDIVTQANIHELFSNHAGVSSSVRRIFELTGRRIEANNPFQSESCVSKYLADFGLRLDANVALRDLSLRLDLAMPIAPSEREKVVGSRKIWTISRRS